MILDLFNTKKINFELNEYNIVLTGEVAVFNKHKQIRLELIK